MTSTASEIQWRPVTPAPVGVIWHGTADIPADWGPCVVTIGVFDGVHRGHARLIERTITRARRLRLPTVMITFDPHPARVAGPFRDTSTLSTPGRRAELAHHHGIDAVLILPFTTQLAQMSAPDFVQHVLVDNLRVRAVIIGNGFTFGAMGRGNLNDLRFLGRRHGFTAEGVDLLHHADTRFSSTYIRQCIAAGDIDAATNALGRPHRIHGQLNQNTLSIPDGTAVPPPGHYRATVTGSRTFDHPTNVTVLDQRHLTLEHPPPELDGMVIAVDFLADESVSSEPRGGACNRRAKRRPRVDHSR